MNSYEQQAWRNTLDKFIWLRSREYKRKNVYGKKFTIPSILMVISLKQSMNTKYAWDGKKREEGQTQKLDLTGVWYWWRFRTTSKGTEFKQY